MSPHRRFSWRRQHRWRRSQRVRTLPGLAEPQGLFYDASTNRLPDCRSITSIVLLPRADAKRR